MSHWFHRNPLKATNKCKFDLGTVATTTQARQILSDAAVKRIKLLEMLQSPNNNVELMTEAVDQYLSVLLGFVRSTEPQKEGDSSLRHSVNFRWSQSLSLKGDIPMEAYDAVFELSNMMVNVALWFTKHAAKLSANENVDMETAKEIHRCLRAAAGIFSDVRNTHINSLGAAITNVTEGTDLDPQILEAYINQCTAEAQEVTMARAIELEHSPSIVASLAFETSKMFEGAALALSNLNPKSVAKWQKYLEFKQSCYRAYAYSYHGEQKLKEDKAGDAIASLKEAVKFYQESEQKIREYAKSPGPGMTARPQEHLFFRKLGPHLQRTLDKCNRENGLIYHQKVPDHIPLLELKATYGLVAPETYKFPEVHSAWSAAYKGFDITKLAWKYGSNAEKQKADDEKKKEEGPIPPVKEEPIYQTDKDPSNNSGCSIS